MGIVDLEVHLVHHALEPQFLLPQLVPLPLDAFQLVLFDLALFIFALLHLELSLQQLDLSFKLFDLHVISVAHQLLILTLIPDLQQLILNILFILRNHPLIMLNHLVLFLDVCLQPEEEILLLCCQCLEVA